MITQLIVPKPNIVFSPGEFYKNRADEINSILDILRGNRSDFGSSRICLISGQPGIGKTELCRVVSDQLQIEFPDGQLYFLLDQNIPDNVSLFNLYETVVHSIEPLAQIPADLNDLAELYLAALEEKRVLIILDGVQSGSFLDRLPQQPSCGYLAATENADNNSKILTFTLGALPQEYSEQLLFELCQRIGKHASSLASICQNVPINLSLVSGYLNYNPTIQVDRFSSELASYLNQSLEKKECITERILDYIFARLTSTEQEVFSQLSIFTGIFDRRMAEGTISVESTHDFDVESVQPYLDLFTQLNFLVHDRDKELYQVLPPIQKFTLSRLRNIPEAWSRLGNALGAAFESVKSLANRSADGYLLSQALFDDYKSTIKKLLEFLLHHESIERDHLLLDLFDLVCSTGRSRFSPEFELVPLLEAMVGAATRLGNTDKLILILGELTNTYQILGEVERERYYSELQEDQIQNNQVGSIKEGIEIIPQESPEEEHNPQTHEITVPDILPSELEELSINKTKIILTGFMATGKTTVGKLLADNLNYDYIDTDVLIETRYSRSISKIFQELGEDAFREMEREVVKEIAERDSVVISTGGRLMLDPENVIALSNNSRVLCLVATPDEILSRVVEDTSHPRPLLAVPNPKERIVELLRERNAEYRRYPQIVTDEKKPVDIARGLVEFVKTSPKSLTVENPQIKYEYVVGAGLLPFLRQLTGIVGEIAIITDETVRDLYGPSCASIGHLIVIPSGQNNKSISTVESVYDQLLEKKFERSGTIVALGGSNVGDVAGFTAATYMRGVNFVQCPTSLLAMVDTSVGGKTGIDLPQGKNIIGIYKQPAKVIADVATLQTLPQQDFASGMAEVIKHGLVAKSDLLAQVEQGYWSKNWDRSPAYIGELQRLVAQAIQVKINIVQSDPFEEGQRSILNLGHTFAHAIEQVSRKSFRHGEAVSLGLIAAANLSARLGYCDSSLQQRIEHLLESVNLPTRIPSTLKSSSLLQAMHRDKKKRAGKLRFVLLRGIGEVFVSDEVSDQDVVKSISALSE